MSRWTPKTRWGWVHLVLRISIGALLLYASLTKWGLSFKTSVPFVSYATQSGPTFFAQKIAQYDLLPGILIPSFSLGILGLELVLGCCLLAGKWVRSAAWLALALFVVFGAAVLYAIMTHKQIDCGCFGTDPVPATWGNLFRDDVFPLSLTGLLLWIDYKRQLRPSISANT